MTQKMTDFERIKGWNEKSPKRISSCSRRSEAYSIYSTRDWSIFGSYWPVYRHRWLHHWFQLLCPVIFMWPKVAVLQDRPFSEIACLWPQMTSRFQNLVNNWPWTFEAIQFGSLTQAFQCAGWCSTTRGRFFHYNVERWWKARHFIQVP